LYEEPVDHAIGRSRGGFSSKIHQLVTATAVRWSCWSARGQANDSPVFPTLLANLRVQRCGGRPRITPDAVIGDKAYSARGHRALLRSRGITAVIPVPSD
jgi:hypothetical protein